MTRREAKRWACSYAAATLSADMDIAVSLTDEKDRECEKKRDAMQVLIQELRNRGHDNDPDEE